MRRIGLTVMQGSERAAEAARRAGEILRQAGAEVIAAETVSAADRPDALVALGGDGTMLRAAQTAAAVDLPLLGINLGTMGFLAEVEADGLQEALHRLLAGDFTEEKRGLLAVTVGKERYLAMNDAVLSRGGYARLISVRAQVDGSWAGEYRADGLIVATPTGSTGYSLSAGGPIIAPGVDCMLITPICPHSLQHRPQVVSGEARVELTILAEEQVEALLQIDGQSRCTLRAGDRVQIARAAESVRLIRMRGQGFFDLVHQKLIEWSR
ncbi:MAG: NAD(+)/NADH kinase [Clostridia bacterium]|nr:NAD(+)/NADH kinase [Clostridia bacterium]